METNLVAVRDFRDNPYACLYRRADALFAPTDALLPAGPRPSPVHLSGEPVYAVDGSAWARCDAATSPERGFYYHPSRHSAGQPIVAGWNYQWLAQVGFARESGTAPLDVRRVRAWAGLRPKRQDRTGRGTKGPTPLVRMPLVRVEVSRLPRPTRTPKAQ